MDKLSQMLFKEIGGLDHVFSHTTIELILDFDLEAGYDFLLQKYEFIDENRTVALGASYGGYMVYSTEFLANVR